MWFAPLQMNITLRSSLPIATAYGFILNNNNLWLWVNKCGDRSTEKNIRSWLFPKLGVLPLNVLQLLSVVLCFGYSSLLQKLYVLSVGGIWGKGILLVQQSEWFGFATIPVPLSLYVEIPQVGAYDSCQRLLILRYLSLEEICRLFLNVSYFGFEVELTLSTVNLNGASCRLSECSQKHPFILDISEANLELLSRLKF